MNKDAVSCDDCGGLFASPYHLRKHVGNGCAESPALKRRKVASWEEENVRENATFKHFANETFAENENLWAEKFEKYEKQGMDKKASKHKAELKMIDQDKQVFFSKYRAFLKLATQLRDSSIHHKILENINERVDDGEVVGTAIKRAIHDEKQDFDPLFDVDINEETDDDSDDNSDDDSDDSDENAEDDDSENEADDSDENADENAEDSDLKLSNPFLPL
jgi:hypothetical protein